MVTGRLLRTKGLAAEAAAAQGFNSVGAVEAAKRVYQEPVGLWLLLSAASAAPAPSGPEGVRGRFSKQKSGQLAGMPDFVKNFREEHSAVKPSD
ncbi:hypothetical protein [Thiohalomonas denitrificans]|uniref:Uncharacterized protein n=1 Tax=Thiohalomonas denitrificans TaxID=415747 RepID=A0A1G5PMD9_9GAMM|nr:hypothetical protein [Thiohalomonas denitrificans]SCZ50714.1 hypothetical protein SAMN03097708_00480 [Thiohalomonas denitrificans]